MLHLRLCPCYVFSHNARRTMLPNHLLEAFVFSRCVMRTNKGDKITKLCLRLIGEVKSLLFY